MADPGQGQDLLIACGNSLRRDDGVGWRLAEQVEAWGRPDLEVIAVQQLAPELATRITAARRVLFVDACVPGRPGAGAGPKLEALPAGGSETHCRAPALSHGSSPLALLELAERLYGHRPPAWQLLLEARSLGYGTGLSPAVAACLPEALAAIQRLFPASPARAQPPCTN